MYGPWRRQGEYKTLDEARCAVRLHCDWDEEMEIVSLNGMHEALYSKGKWRAHPLSWWLALERMGEDHITHHGAIRKHNT